MPRPPPVRDPNHRSPRTAFHSNRDRPSTDLLIRFLRASWRRQCSIRVLRTSFEPLPDRDLRSSMRLRFDGELVHQSPDAGQSQAEPPGGRKTIAQHVVDISNTWPAIASTDQNSLTLDRLHAAHY